MRYDFSSATATLLARRVGVSCSNPDCGRQTSGPSDDPAKAVNIGVAAHITAASPGGPRFDATLTPQERQSPENGIWLCQQCSRLVDSDTAKYTVALLTEWKRRGEARASSEISARLTHGRDVSTPTAHLVLEELGLVYPPEQRAYYLTFTLANVGRSIALVRNLSLKVIRATELNLLEAPREAAVLQMIDYEIHLTPGTSDYLLGSGHFVYKHGAVDGFRLKITGEEGFAFDIQVHAEWSSMGSSPRHVLSSQVHSLRFFAYSSAVARQRLEGPRKT